MVSAVPREVLGSHMPGPVDHPHLVQSTRNDQEHGRDGPENDELAVIYQF